MCYYNSKTDWQVGPITRKNDGYDYSFYLKNEGGGIRVLAGCRDLFLREALKHFGSPTYISGSSYHTLKAQRESMFIIHMMVELAKVRGWVRSSVTFPAAPTVSVKKTVKVKKVARRR